MLVHFTTALQLFVYVNVEFLYTRFLTFMLISTMVLCGGKKQGEAQRAEQ